MARKGTARTCPKGHRYYRNRLCRVCPVCEKGRPASAPFLAALYAPARRALEGAGITTLEKLSAYSESEILSLHGIGPSAIPKLKAALKAAGLSFRKASPG